MRKRVWFGLAGGILLAAVSAVAVDVPRPAPDFSINMTDGQRIALKQYKGKVCVLAFILTTCPHCQKTVGFLSTMQKDYGPQGLQVVASAIDDMAKMLVPDFITRFHPPFPVGYSNLNETQAFLQHPTMLRLLMPQVVFMDRQGVIRAQYAGDDKFFADDQEKHLRDQIEALLKDSTTSKKKAPAKTKRAS